MTILVTSDFHLTENPRDDYRFNTLTTLRLLGRKHRVTHTIILGDLTEAKDRHSAWLTNQVVYELHQFAKECVVIALRGNHDASDAENPFFEFVRRIDGISWINNPTAFEIGSIGKCMFLPHTTNHDVEWRDMDFADMNYIFAHNTFRGATSEGGRVLDGIPPEIFPKRARVISGDVHAPQTFGPITYVGAPYTVDFGDDYEPRCLLLDGKEQRSIQIPGVQKRLVEMTWPRIAHENTVNRDDILKVRVRIEPADYAKWGEIREAVRAWGKKNKFVVHTVQPIVDVRQSPKRARLRTTRRKTDKEIMTEYAARRGIDDRTLKAGLEFC